MKANPARDFSIGFVLFIATIIVMGALFVVGDGGGLFSDQVRYQVEMPNANGLREGDRVRLANLPVGKITEIGFAPDPEVASVIVKISIDSDHARRLGSDSKAWVKTVGLLGDMELHLSLSATAEPLPPGSEIPYSPYSILDEIAGEGSTQTATNLMETAIAIMQDIHRGEGTLGQLLKSPDLYENLTAFTQAMRTATEEVEKVTREVDQILVTLRTRQGLLGKVIFSEEYAERIRQPAKRREARRTLERIAARAERGEGSLGRLLGEPELHDNLVRTLAGIDSVAQRTAALLESDAARESVVARLLSDAELLGGDFRSLVARLDRSAGAMAEILVKIQRGEGSIGMMVNDPSIAGGIRDVILGVHDLGYVRNVVRNAERSGREGYLRAARLGEAQERELLRVQGLARLGIREPDDARDDGENSEKPSGLEGEGAPQPASGVDEARPVPATDSGGTFDEEASQETQEDR